MISMLAYLYALGPAHQRALIHEEKGGFYRIETTLMHLTQILQRVYNT